MTTVTNTGNRRYTAWCSKCSDGLRGTKKQAEKWADTHEAEKHPKAEG